MTFAMPFFVDCVHSPLPHFVPWLHDLEEIAERNRDYYTNLDEKLDGLSKKLNFTSDLLRKERIKNQKIATEPWILSKSDNLI